MRSSNWAANADFLLSISPVAPASVQEAGNFCTERSPAGLILRHDRKKNRTDTAEAVSECQTGPRSVTPAAAAVTPAALAADYLKLTPAADVPRARN